MLSCHFVRQNKSSCICRTAVEPLGLALDYTINPGSNLMRTRVHTSSLTSQCVSNVCENREVSHYVRTLNLCASVFACVHVCARVHVLA